VTTSNMKSKKEESIVTKSLARKESMFNFDDISQKDLGGMIKKGIDSDDEETIMIAGSSKGKEKRSILNLRRTLGFE
jgi:hypothetical protein